MPTLPDRPRYEAVEVRVRGSRPRWLVWDHVTHTEVPARSGWQFDDANEHGAAVYARDLNTQAERAAAQPKPTPIRAKRTAAKRTPKRKDTDQ